MTLMNYRPDIDGLRAISVLLVLMYHLGCGIPGGYIGVDVFFVISGFLITGIITRELDDHGAFSLAGFYARRARRILPALFAVILLSSVAAIFILLPTDLERYAKSVVATMLSISNFWFWSQGGYFGAASELSPLLHTWTLAVEEQFYLFMPIALLALHRWVPHWIVPLFVTCCVGSFAASALLVSTRTPEVFYFSPFRAWELLLGSLLALYRLPVLVSNLWRQLIALAGLSLVIAPAFIFTTDTVFPGPAAALPCVGAALLIWIGASGRTIVGNLLTSRAFIFFGLISYSLYLWHWPLLVFTKHIVGESLRLDHRIGIGLASIALATLSWRFVETPFRSRDRVTDKQAWILSGASSALLVGMVIAVLQNQGLQSRFSPEIVALDRARTREDVRSECINFRAPLNKDTACHIGAPGAATILVWGDSYAHAMLPAFDTAFKRLGIAGHFVAESGCPPLPVARISFRGQDNWRCREFNEKVLKFVRSQPVVSRVVLAAAWDAYATESSGYKLRADNTYDSAAAMHQGIEELITQLKAIGANHDLIIIGQVPTFEWSVPHKMLLGAIRNEPISALTRQAWMEKSAISRGIFGRLKTSSHITFIDTAEWLCATGVCRFATENGRPLYWDGGHINSEGARLIAPMLEVAFRSLRYNSSEQYQQ